MNRKYRAELQDFMGEVINLCLQYDNVDMAKRALDFQKKASSIVGRTTYTEAQKDEVRKKAKKLKDEGMSWPAIAEECGVKAGTIWNWVEGREAK